MSLEIKLTKEQLKLLIKLVYLGKATTENHSKQKLKTLYTHLYQMLLEKAFSEGLSEWVVYDKKTNSYTPSNRLENDKEIVKLLEQYEASVLWYELSYRLAEQEILLTEGPRAFDGLSLEEIFIKRARVMQKYYRELSRHGLRNFILRDNCLAAKKIIKPKK